MVIPFLYHTVINLNQIGLEISYLELELSVITQATKIPYLVSIIHFWTCQTSKKN